MRSLWRRSRKLMALCFLCQWSASACIRKTIIAPTKISSAPKLLSEVILTTSAILCDPSVSVAAESVQKSATSALTTPPATLQERCRGSSGVDITCAKEVPKPPPLPGSTTVPPRAPASVAAPVATIPTSPPPASPTPESSGGPESAKSSKKSSPAATASSTPESTGSPETSKPPKKSPAAPKLTSLTIRKIAKKLPTEWAQVLVVDDEEVIDLFQGIQFLPNMRFVARKLNYKEAATAAAIAGATAEVIATGVLYPLDTIKTRLQSQTVALLSAEEGSAPNKGRRAVLSVYGNVLRKEVTGAYNWLLQLQKTRGRIRRESLPKRAAAFFASLCEPEILVDKPRELVANASRLVGDAYRGVVPELAVAIPQGATFFATRDLVRKLLGSAASSSSAVTAAAVLAPSIPREYASLLAIALADVLYWVVRSPAQKLQTNLQVRRKVVIRLSEGKQAVGVLRNLVYGQQSRNEANMRVRRSMKLPEKSRRRDAKIRTAAYQNDIRVQDVFDAIDVDGNGKLDKKELRRALIRSGKFDKKLSDDLIRFCDMDGDGSIDFNEFQEAIRAVTFSQEKQRRELAAPGEYLIRLPELWKDYWVLITTDVPQLILRAALLLLLDKYWSLGNTEAYLVAASASAVFCTPLDVCRTRILLDSGESDNFGALRSPAPVRVVKTIRKIYIEEGIGALYSGWFFRLLLSGIVLGGFLPFKARAYESARTEVVLDILDDLG